MSDDLALRLGELLGGEVHDVVRLSGGASRETWSFVLDGTRLILQRQRPGGGAAAGTKSPMVTEAAVLRAAAAAGVPVAPLRYDGTDSDALGAPFFVTEAVEGETIARKILRDDEYAEARPVLAAQCGNALGAIHSIPVDAVPGLDQPDQIQQYRDLLDLLGEPHPTFELGLRWLDQQRPPPGDVAVVHGDFRLGNLIVGPDGLRAVLDWELVHLGDPYEDLGWLCVRAWRFGSSKPVAGVGEYEDLVAAYGEATGRDVDRDRARWWEIMGTLKWGVMCILQASSHLNGLTRSVELAAIGRRVAEQEYDLLRLLP